MQQGTFGYDLEFLRKHHKDLVLLENGDARLIVLPAYQGRIMTSTAEGNAGASFGWLNHELIASGKFTEHFSAFGGEERFWLGPEGGHRHVPVSSAGSLDKGQGDDGAIDGVRTRDLRYHKPAL